MRRVSTLVVLLAAFFAFRGPAPRPAPTLGMPQLSWLRAGLTVMFAYQGFEIVPVIAGQVRSAARSVPLATVGSLLVAIALYLGLMWACVVALPGLAGAEAPLVQAAVVYGGANLSWLVALGTSVSALGISFGMIVTTPRYLSALAAGERSFFGLDKIGGRGVPTRAFFVTWVLVTIFVNLGGLQELFALSSIAVLMQYGVTAAALVVLAWRRQRGLRLVDAWPALPTLVVTVVLVLFGATWQEALVALGTLVLGVIVLLLARPRDQG